MNPNNLDNDTLALDDTLCNEQVLLSDDQQATQLKHSRLAHFKIIDILGKGGMGAVYKAKDLALERFVAIKMIHISKDQRPLILAEAKTISKLNHPNIVTVYDIARDEDANFIVMEWVDGQPLNAVIPSQGLPLKKVLAYTQQIVAALSCAHQQLIIHRDIKPQNIMVDVKGHIKVLDFGIAALIEPLEQEPSAPEPSAEKKQEPSADQEQPSAPEPSAEKKQEPSADHKQPIITGSPLYMAPEQILGQASDARSDLFSLGIVLYEMLTGVKPFLGFNFQQISQAITKGQYMSLAELIVEQKAEQKAEKKAEHKTESKTALPAELIAIVDKLLQVEPSARYQSAAELAQELNVIDEKINHKKNWWQQQHWLMKVVIAMPLMVILAWSIRSVLFPPSTQELIARQLLESKKIAFLPFDNISGDPVLQIFSDGIATMLSSDLAEVGYQQGDGTTWVLPISDIRNLEDPTIAGIYNKYGVDVIITGSIQHMGSTRNIHLSLINGADGRQLKSIQLTIDANKLFAAQTQIRQEVMTLLGWQIPAELTKKLATKKPAFDGAYQHYLAGQGYLYRFDHGDNITKALESFQSAIALDSNYADAYVGLAQAQLRSFLEYQDINLLKTMKKTVKRLDKVDGNHPLLSYLLGELKLNQGDYSKAVTLFEHSIMQQPNFLKAYVSLSISYLELGELVKAEQILLNAYQLMPNNNAVLIELGIFHYGSGDYERAIEYFELLAQQAPNNYIAYLNVSVCHYLNGNVQKAIISAQQSINIRPNAEAYSNIGTYHFNLDNYDKAVGAFEQMIGLNDTDYINWGNLADAYRFSNNDKYSESFKQAIMLAKQAIELNPNDKYSIASLAYYYANIKDTEKALYYAKQVTANDSGENQFFIAAAYTRLHMNAEAIEYLKYAINNNYSITDISSSPLFYGLTSEQEFRQLIARTSK